jgi:hypothetical protein
MRARRRRDFADALDQDLELALYGGAAVGGVPVFDGFLRLGDAAVTPPR